MLRSLLLRTAWLGIFLLGAGCSQGASTNPVTDDSGEVRTATKKVDDDLVGAWTCDDGSQEEIFVFRKDGSYLRAYRAVEQPASALDRQREEGSYVAEGQEGTFVAKTAPEGKPVPAPMAFEYEFDLASREDGTEAIVGLMLDRERGGVSVEGSQRNIKMFQPAPNWCTAENDCEL